MAGKKRGEGPHFRQRSTRGWELTYTDAAGQRDTITIRARNKSEARRLRDEFMAQVERARLGLDRAIVPMTLAAAFNLYKVTASAKSSWSGEEGRWRNHILALDEEGRAHTELARKLIHAITPDDINVLLVAKHKEGKAPGTVYQLRAHLSRFYTWAIKEKRILRGENPAELARLPAPLPTPNPKAMSEEQLTILLNRGVPDFATFFLLLTAAFTAMRRGELAGLPWRNVHEAERYVWVEFSFDQPTKGKRARRVPIHRVLLPYIQEARERARTELVFPDEDGTMRPQWWDAAELFRSCLRRAGLIQGWELRCGKRPGARTGSANPKAKLTPEQVAELRTRVAAGERVTDVARGFGVTRQAVLHHLRTQKQGPKPLGKCGYVAKALVSEKVVEPCPNCQAPMHAVAIPLAFTLKSLRSTFGSNAVESSGGLRVPQLILGHADQNTTDRSYANRRDPFLEAAMDQVRIVAADSLPTPGSAPWLSRALPDSGPEREVSELPPVTSEGAS